MRSLAITILRLVGHISIAAALRYHARRPDPATMDDHELLNDFCRGSCPGLAIRAAQFTPTDSEPAGCILRNTGRRGCLSRDPGTRTKEILYAS
jgi:hypothetical protein